MINWSLLEQGERFDSQGNLATEHRLDDPGVCIRKTSTSGFDKVAKKKKSYEDIDEISAKAATITVIFKCGFAISLHHLHSPTSSPAL